MNVNLQHYTQSIFKLTFQYSALINIRLLIQNLNVRLLFDKYKDISALLIHY